MGEIRTCKWCGRSYDTSKSSSRYSYAYCSLRCEIQGEKATNNSEARSDRRFMNYFVIPLIIFGVIISIFGDHDEKSDNKKKSAKTERTKNAATTNNESDATYNSAAESDIEKINESLLDKTNEEAKLSATEEEQLELQILFQKVCLG